MAIVRMWTAKLCHPDEGFLFDVECDAFDLLRAAQKLSKDVKWPCYLTDLCCRGTMTVPDPVPMVLNCPACCREHLDVGEWAVRPHKTHKCEGCQTEWTPEEFATRGVCDDHA